MLDMDRIPLREWINDIVRHLRFEYRGFFNAVSEPIRDLVSTFEAILMSSVPGVLAAVVLLAMLAGGWRLGLFTLLGLGLIENLGLWEKAMQTTSLVLAAGLVCVAIGLPLGIVAARWKPVEKVVKPTLDFMQTMPAFVYLIPALTFFQFGAASALFATVIFAMPPMVRLVMLGIQNVDSEVVEASSAFGATSWQTLFKVELPLARPSIMVGVNQMLMMSLSMVVIAAMVGAQGLGAVVYEGISTLDSGRGFEGGLGIVILAVVIDRITQGLGAPRLAGEKRSFFAGAKAGLGTFLRGFSPLPRVDRAPPAADTDSAAADR